MILNPVHVAGRGRAYAEQMMTDRCVIERKTGRVLNEDTGKYEDTWITVYEGKCRVQVSKYKPVEETPGGAVTYHIDDATVQLPVDDTVYKREDRVRVTYASMDPALTRQDLIVKDMVTKTHDVMRRLGVAEVTT